MKVHHIGYLVQNIDAAINNFKKQGWQITREKIFDEAREIFVCFMENSGVIIELVQPSEDCRLFTKLQKRIGNAPYHICYLSGETDFEKLISNLQEQGNFLVRPPQNAVALENRKVVFFMNEFTGLFEVIDKNTLDNNSTENVIIAKSQEPRAKSQEPRAKSQEPRAIIMLIQSFTQVKKLLLPAA